MTYRRQSILNRMISKSESILSTRFLDLDFLSVDVFVVYLVFSLYLPKCNAPLQVKQHAES